MKPKELIEIIEELGKQRKHIHIVYSVDEKQRICGFNAYAGKPQSYSYNGLILDMSHTYSYMKARELTGEDTAIIDMKELLNTSSGEYSDWRDFGNVGGNFE